MVVSIPSPPPKAFGAARHAARTARLAPESFRGCRPVPFYRPRRPRDSPMFQLLERHFAEFERVYAERFAASYGHWPRKLSGLAAHRQRHGGEVPALRRPPRRFRPRQVPRVQARVLRRLLLQAALRLPLLPPEAVVDPLRAARGGGLLARRPSPVHLHRAEHDDARRFPQPAGGVTRTLLSALLLDDDSARTGVSALPEHASQSAVAAAAEQALRAGSRPADTAANTAGVAPRSRPRPSARAGRVVMLG